MHYVIDYVTPNTIYISLMTKLLSLIQRMVYSMDCLHYQRLFFKGSDSLKDKIVINDVIVEQVIKFIYLGFEAT